MLGLGNGSRDKDKLSVLVTVLQDTATFDLVKKLWELNNRNVRYSEANHKEFLHFGLLDAKQAVWLERDQGRQDAFELILTWAEGDVRLSDVYAIVASQGGVSSGNSNYATQILKTLLSTPATLPVDKATR